MKRKREMKMEMEMGSEMKSAIEELSSMVVFINTKAGGDFNISSLHIPTKPFLSLCNCLVQVLDKIGPTMFVLRQDIHQNIQRLETLHDSDPSLYSNLVEIVKKEKNEASAKKKGPSCSKALVWLTRSLDFTAALLQRLVEDVERSMEEAVEESYNMTLKPWHGWISSAAYGIAVKLVPDRASLMRILMNKQEKNNDILNKEIRTFISLLLPVLQEIHSVLETYGLNRIKAT